MLNRRDNPPKAYPFAPNAEKAPIRGFLDLRVMVAGPPTMAESEIPAAYRSDSYWGHSSWLLRVSSGSSGVVYTFRFVKSSSDIVEVRDADLSVPRGSGVGRFSTMTPSGIRIDAVMDSDRLTSGSQWLADRSCLVEPCCAQWLSDSVRSVTFMVSRKWMVDEDAEITASFRGPATVSLAYEGGYGFSMGAGFIDLAAPPPVASMALPSGDPPPSAYDGLISLGGVGADAKGDIPLRGLDPVLVSSPGVGQIMISRVEDPDLPKPDKNPNPVYRVARKRRVMAPDESGYEGYECVKVGKLILDPPDCEDNKILTIPAVIGTSRRDTGMSWDGPWVYSMPYNPAWPLPTVWPHTCDGIHHYDNLIPSYPFMTPRTAEFGENVYPVCFDVKRRCDGPESDYCGYWKIANFKTGAEQWVPLREKRPWDKSTEMVPSNIISKARYGVPEWFDGYIQFNYCPPRELSVCFDIFQHEDGTAYVGYYDQDGKKVENVWPHFHQQPLPVDPASPSPPISSAHDSIFIGPRKVHSDFVYLDRYMPAFTRECSPSGGDEPEPSSPNGYYFTFHCCTPLPTRKSPETFPVVVTGRQGPFHTVELHEDGYGLPSTGSGTLFVTGLNLSDTLPAGTWTLGVRSALAVTGGGSV